MHQSSTLAKLARDGQIAIVCAMYDVTKGEVSFLDADLTRLSPAEQANASSQPDGRRASLMRRQTLRRVRVAQSHAWQHGVNILSEYLPESLPIHGLGQIMRPRPCCTAAAGAPCCDDP